MADTPDPKKVPLDPETLDAEPGVTATYKLLGAEIDKATQQKKKARGALSRIFDLLGRKDK